MAALQGDQGDNTDEAYAEWTRRFEKLGETRAERARTFYGTRTVARGRLSADDTRLEDVQVLLEAPVQRFVFGLDGTLFATTPLAGPVDAPQQKNLPQGKVLRINPDGTIPDDNPWTGEAGTHPALFAVGFRAPQGVAIHPPPGDLWTIENGPRGGDELNIVKAGRNYGWPVISYGRNYDTSPIRNGESAQDGMEQPIYFWSPSIAPSDFMFYTGDMFPEWKGNIFVAAMVGEHLSRLVLFGNRVVAEERLLLGLEHRIKDVRQGPDGALYVLTDADDGLLLKLTRKPLD